MYNPTCGADKITYVSPCYAGCKAADANVITQTQLKYESNTQLKYQILFLISRATLNAVASRTLTAMRPSTVSYTHLTLPTILRV